MRTRRPLGLITLAVTLLVPLSLITAPNASARTVVAPGAPSTINVSLPDRSTTATLTWGDPSTPGDSTATGFEITGFPDGSTSTVGTSVHSVQVTGLVPGQQYDLTVAATTSTDEGPAADVSFNVKTWMPTTAPTMTLEAQGAYFYVLWHEPANPGNASFTTWRVTDNGNVFNADYGSLQGIKLSNAGNGPHTVKLQLLGQADLGSATPTATRSTTIGASAPRIGKASSGAKGGKSTAVVRWSAPATTRGYRITSYRAVAFKLNSKGKILGYYLTGKLKSSARSYSGRLPKGRYKFQVVAYTALGSTQLSHYSRVVTAR
jgi:hypothetical protein